MCYGMGCRYEGYMGECRKPNREICPVDLILCKGCEELFLDNNLYDVNNSLYCKDCLDEIEDEE